MNATPKLSTLATRLGLLRPWPLLVAVLTAALTAKGFGSKTFFLLNSLSLISLVCWRAFSTGDKILGIALTAGGVAFATLSWLPQLTWPITLYLLALSKSSKNRGDGDFVYYQNIALTNVVYWVILKIDIATVYITPLNSGACFLLIALAIHYARTLRIATWCAAITISLIISGQSVFDTLKTKDISIENYAVPNVNVFPHGEVIKQIISGRLSPKGETSGDIGIINLIFGHTESKANNPFILVEHDVLPSESYPVIAKESLHQRKPWEYNQLFGDELLLAAIARDGYWASNLGGSLQPKGRVLLGSLRHYEGHEDTGKTHYYPIAIRHESKTYLQDSDPFVDWLSNGQRNTLLEFTRGTLDLRLLNMGLVIICAIMLCTANTTLMGMVLVLLMTIAVEFIYQKTTIEGDLHLVGIDGGPHELSKTGGVVRSIIERGYPILLSSKPASIVVLSKGRSYTLTGVEKLVILSSDSRVITGDGIIQSGNTPLGPVQGVVDARSIEYKDLTVDAVFKREGVTYIATDSPAKLDWSKWLPQS